VILEYKRASNENVINQGLFYLDWLMDHRKDFQWPVLEKLGKKDAEAVDWSAPRLICIAGDFNRYDDHAVKQIQRNIELFRCRRFDADLLMLDLLAATSVKGAPVGAPDGAGPSAKYKTVSAVIEDLDASMTDRFEALRAYLMALGDDVQEATLRFYIAFKRIKNFACVEFRPTTGKILLYVKVDAPRSCSVCGAHEEWGGPQPLPRATAISAMDHNPPPALQKNSETFARAKLQCVPAGP
jgi:hypothetical protein